MAAESDFPDCIQAPRAGVIVKTFSKQSVSRTDVLEWLSEWSEWMPSSASCQGPRTILNVKSCLEK